MVTSLAKCNSLEIKYNDRYFRLVLGAVAAHIIVMYNVDKGFFEALFTLSYLRGFIGSWLIAMCMIEFVHYVTVRLDKKFDWQTNTLFRLFWQLLIAFAAPALLAFLLAAFFFWVFDRNIFQTTYLQQDYTLVIFMLLAINIYYFGLNSFLRLRHTVVKLNIPPDQKPDTISKSRVVSRNPQPDNREIKQVIVVDTLTKSIPVKVETISYCYILSGNVFIRTIDMDNLHDSYAVPGNLRSLEESLDQRMFFRINRQLIVSFSACKYYKPGKNKTLELVIEPLPYPNVTQIPDEHKRLCVVSEDRAAAFKLWMDR